MGKRHVPYEERAEFFELVCAGLSVQAAAAWAGVSVTAGRGWWSRSGLVDPRIQFGRYGGLPGSAPARVPGEGGPDEPPRARRPLSSEDRAAIAVGLMCQASHAQIGRMIGRHRSVIGREIKRNSGPDGSYWGAVAHRAAHERRRRPKGFKLRRDPGLCRRIEAWMDQGWSPGLISRVLRAEAVAAGLAPRAVKMACVSHETIYRALYVQTRGGLRQDLHRCLSTGRGDRKRHGGPGGPAGTPRANSPYREAFRISERPAEVTDRAVPGHWEGDLVMGTPGTPAVGTLVERSTRFVMLLHLPGRHDADSVAEAMITQMGRLPEHLRRSLTWDRGTEMARYERVQVELAMPVYFCDPHKPWQRGTNENTNRLLRHWLTKGTDLGRFTADDLNKIAASLNARPRPTLNMRTPAQALDQLLANPPAA
jgi:IS30 family transposase